MGILHLFDNLEIRFKIVHILLSSRLNALEILLMLMQILTHSLHEYLLIIANRSLFHQQLFAIICFMKKGRNAYDCLDLHRFMVMNS